MFRYPSCHRKSSLKKDRNVGAGRADVWVATSWALHSKSTTENAPIQTLENKINNLISNAGSTYLLVTSDKSSKPILSNQQFVNTSEKSSTLIQRFFPWQTQTCCIEEGSIHRNLTLAKFGAEKGQKTKLPEEFAGIGGYTPLKTNMVHLKITQLKRKIIFHPPPFFGFHVNCQTYIDLQRGCIRCGIWNWKRRPLAATRGHLPKAATCGHLRPFDRSGHLRSLAATCPLRPRSLAATCPLRPLAVTCGHLPSATCGHWAGLVGHLLQRPLAATCGQSSGCKWLQVTANNEIHCPWPRAIWQMAFGVCSYGKSWRFSRQGHGKCRTFSTW